MYQQIILLGRLGADPELRYTPAGTPVTGFSLAVNRVWTDGSGQQRQKTVWFRITAWRGLAEVAARYLGKGRQVLVIGELEEPGAWLDSEGQPRASLEVTAHTIRFLGGKGPEDAQAATGEPEATEEVVPF